jgi:TRAP-type mannitol/chloroaromatic compound transport system permease small subunit
VWKGGLRQRDHGKVLILPEFSLIPALKCARGSARSSVSCGENPILSPAESTMQFLLSLAACIDALNERIGRWVSWLALAAVLISAGNALIRYTFHMSSNAWLEIQWYLFSAFFLLAAGYTHKHNHHVRLDVLFTRVSPRARAWIDIFGTLLFLLPVCTLIGWLAWPMFMDAWVSNEQSPDAGGLVRWPVKLLIPFGFLLLILQGLAELIKRVAYLRGWIPDPLAPQEHVR